MDGGRKGKKDKSRTGARDFYLDQNFIKDHHQCWPAPGDEVILGYLAFSCFMDRPSTVKRDARASPGCNVYVHISASACTPRWIKKRESNGDSVIAVGRM
jgi:hypothetical protein